MCGRYALFDEAKALSGAWTAWLAEAYALPGAPDERPLRGSQVRPGEIAPVYTVDGPRWMTWGFPRFHGGGLVINARAETASRKPLFHDAVISRRVAVPAAGFYEWHRKDPQRGKDPDLFRTRQDRLWMAGLYTRFQNADGGALDRFVILTTQADDVVAAYHDRMPLLLREEEVPRWLAPGSDAAWLLSRTPLTGAPSVTAEAPRGALRQQSFFIVINGLISCMQDGVRFLRSANYRAKCSSATLGRSAVAPVAQSGYKEGRSAGDIDIHRTADAPAN